MSDDVLSSKCNNCGRVLKSLILLAMLQDAGCHVYPSATHCHEGVEHDFSEKSIAEAQHG